MRGGKETGAGEKALVKPRQVREDLNLPHHQPDNVRGGGGRGGRPAPQRQAQGDGGQCWWYSVLPHLAACCNVERLSRNTDTSPVKGICSHVAGQQTTHSPTILLSDHQSC
jgi:hypothetical protein